MFSQLIDTRSETLTRTDLFHFQVFCFVIFRSLIKRLLIVTYTLVCRFRYQSNKG